MLNPDAIAPKPRKHLSFDPLIGQIRLRAKLFPDTRSGWADENDLSCVFLLSVCGGGEFLVSSDSLGCQCFT